MILQTNDTDLHLHVRRRFIELQTARMVEKARISGGGMVDLTKEENIEIMAQVMSDRALHVQACKGYKYTGTTVALDGSEDDLICREAKDFWDEMGMRSRIDSAVAEVAEKHAAGLLPWTYKTVQSLITPYPRRGHLDEVKLGQEDEATADPDRVPWETDEAREEEEEKGEVAEALDDLFADDEDTEKMDFDPADWVDPDEAARVFATTQGAQDSHGDGDKEDSHGDGDKEEGAAHGMSLDDQQAEHVIQESFRMRSLQEALQLFRNMGNQVGASLASTVTSVLRRETKRHKALSQEDAVVHDELRAVLKDEEAEVRRARLAFKEQMSQEKEKARVKRELQEATEKLKKIRKEQREAEAVVAAMEQMRVYSLEMLGQGKKWRESVSPQSAHAGITSSSESCRTDT